MLMCIFRTAAAAILLCVLAGLHPALAQSVPRGACLLPDGRWCWPINPVRYGETCTCATPEGPRDGTGR